MNKNEHTGFVLIVCTLLQYKYKFLLLRNYCTSLCLINLLSVRNNESFYINPIFQYLIIIHCGLWTGWCVFSGEVTHQ